MIAIVNVSDTPVSYGVQDYEVRINKKVITRFKHRWEDGLAVCLTKASAAVERQRMADLTDYMLQLEDIK